MNKQNIKGSLSFMTFLMFLMLAIWCLNMFKHINSGRWTKGQKMIDIVGALMLLAVFGSMILPILKR
ncbi:MAG: hypothetical protein K6B38_02120 [Ruminococcus sp.]|nr:hypothetical protein [Ruminococcus sp.]